MRKALAKALRIGFEKELKAVCPQFQRRPSEENGGNRLFVWELAPALWGYVQLLLSPYWDEFTIELAWTHRRSFPSNVPPLPKTSVDETPERGALRLPLSYLSIDAGQPKRDEWWALAARPRLDGTEAGASSSVHLAEALLRIEPAIRDVVHLIANVAVPYFRRVADREGRAMDDPGPNR